MSDLAVKVQSDLVAAMKNKDELTLSVLRMLKSSIQLMQVEKGKDKELTDDDVLVLVRRLIKQRVEAAEMYKAGGANDRAERELAEATTAPSASSPRRRSSRPTSPRRCPTKISRLSSRKSPERSGPRGRRTWAR